MLASIYPILVSLVVTQGEKIDSTAAIFVGLNDVEVLGLPDTLDDAINSCDMAEANLSPYPKYEGHIYGASSTVFPNKDGSNVQVVACGGGGGPDYTVTDKCYVIDGNDEVPDWKEHSTMPYPVMRQGAAKFGSVEEGGEYWWLVGGVGQRPDYTPMSASLVFEVSTNLWLPGPLLPNDVAKFGICMVQLNSTHNLMTGGTGGLNENWLYSWITGEWIRTGDFVGGDRFVHGCTVMADGRVMVAAGSHGLPDAPDAGVLNTVEIWDPQTGQWTEVAALPLPMDGNILVGVMDGAWAGDVLNLGGHMPEAFGEPAYYDSIMRYSVAEDTWELVYNMETPRLHFAVAPIPYHCD